jgi:lipase
MLNVHRFGPDDGPAILCLHGVTGHGLRFRRMAEEGLAGRRVIAPDLRGHGRSPWLPPWRVEDHVTDLLELLEAEDIDRVTVIGHSFGGLITTHLMATASYRVDRAVLLDPAIAVDPAYCYDEAEANRTPMSWASLDEAKAYRRTLRVPAGFAGSDADCDDHLEQGPDGRFRFRFCAGAAICAWSEMARPAPGVGGLDIPLLLVTASQAPYVTQATRDWLRGDLGDDFSEVVVDASHMLYWDAYDETMAHVRAFLGLPA